MAVELAVVAALADAASVLSELAAFVGGEPAAAAVTVLLVVVATHPVVVVAVEEQFDIARPVEPFAAVVVAAAVLAELEFVLAESFSSSYQYCVLIAVAAA